MGCVESREKEPASEHLLSSFEGLSCSSSTSNMGQPPSQPHFQPRSGRTGSRAVQLPVITSQLSSQHERLILELLPLKDAQQFHEWLNSVYVRGSWNELLHDFLAQNPTAPEPDKNKIAQMTKDAITSRNPKYLTYHPDKENWNSDDHHIRFMATLISDNLLKGMWSESDWKKKGIEISKAAYEVLSFLRSTTFAVETGPPGYED